MEKFDYNYFESIDTEIKAYFLGFIVADADISKKTNRVSFTLNPKDTYILELFKKELKCNNEIRSYKIFDERTQKTYERVVFQFSNKKIKEDLKKLGVDEYKSLKFEQPKIGEKFIWHFLRGLIDGDGSISNTKLQVTLISTYEFLRNLVMYLVKYDIKLSTNFYCLNKDKNTRRISIQGDKNVNIFLENLYKDATIYFDRKYQNYLKLKNVTKNLSHACRIKKVSVIDKLSGKEVNNFNTVKDCMNFYKLTTNSFYYKEHPLYNFKTGDFEKLNIKYNERI